MLNEQVTLLYPVVAIFLLLTVFVLYVYYTSDRHYRIKLLLWPDAPRRMRLHRSVRRCEVGLRVACPLPTSFQYFAHRTVVVGGAEQ